MKFTSKINFYNKIYGLTQMIQINFIHINQAYLLHLFIIDKISFF